MSFDTKNYWEDRLDGNFNFSGVGFHAIGKGYNYWLYCARKLVFQKALHKIPLQIATSRILDVGSGTGFYVGLLQKRKVARLSAMDFTHVSVRNLAGKFPGYNFTQGDISDPGVIYRLEDNYDIIIAMDVFFHIVDDIKYTLALENISKLLSDEGFFLISENPVASEKTRGHIKDRTQAQIGDFLQKAGFKITETIPMFILLNPPVASANRMLWRFSNLRLQVLRWAFKKDINAIGFLMGLLLFPLELLLQVIWGNKKGPCTNIYIVKKISATRQ